MRIAFISHLGLNLFRFRGPVIRLAVAEGHEVHVLVPDAAHDAGLREMGAEVHHYPLARGSMNPLRLPVSVRALRRLLDAVRPQLAHSFTHQPNILTRLAVRRLAVRPAVLNSVTGLGSCFLGLGLKGAAVRALFAQLYRRTAAWCDVLVFQNADDRAYFERRGLVGPGGAQTVRGSGVDVFRFRPDALTAGERAAARAELGFGPGEVVFTLTARLIADKGVFEFLEAARVVREALPEARFLLVGEPDPGNPASLTPERMRAAARESGAVFAGWREDMERVWALSDVAVLPSYREGLPVSLQEALAAGLPVVTTDVPGCREIAGGEYCALVPARESRPLAAAMLAFGRDAALRERVGLLARARAEADFDARVAAVRHVEMYEAVVRRKA
jgi:glycosyltransferase involved in cell wall biosynthesis